MKNTSKEEIVNRISAFKDEHKRDINNLFVYFADPSRDRELPLREYGNDTYVNDLFSSDEQDEF